MSHGRSGEQSMNDTIALQRADREQGAVHVRSDK